MKITRLEEIDSMKMDMAGAEKVYKQVPISRQDGSPKFSFRVFTVQPEGHTPFHQHPFEHLNYVIEGNGALVVEGGREYPVKKGDFILVLPDERHQYQNKDGKTPLVFLCAVPKEYE